VFVRKKFLVKSVDLNFFILLLFSLSYAAFFLLDPVAGNQYIVVYAFVPVTLYLLGKYFADKLNNDIQKLFILFLISGVIFSITSFLSVITDLLTNGFADVNRNLPNFWTGQIIPATITGSYFSVIMTIPALLIPRIKGVSKLIKVFLLIYFFISIACVLRIGSRTQLGISVIALVASLLFIVPKQSFKRNIFLIVLFAGSILYIVQTVNFDLNQDWLSAYANRMEDNDDFSSGGGRTIRWEKSLINLFEKPLGWDEDEFGHAHNLWFDVLRIGGIIPFILLIIYTSANYLIILGAIKKKVSDFAFQNQILVNTIGFTTVFTLEPILEGMFDFFAFFCFFSGAVKSFHAS
tara:strand:- start:1078 stop:2127 length:1050 start_codon:yes stop_codon:yes gene_type:complete